MQERSLLGFRRSCSVRIFLWIWIRRRSRQAKARTLKAQDHPQIVFDCGLYVRRAGVEDARSYMSIRSPVYPSGLRRPAICPTSVLSRWRPSYCTVLEFWRCAVDALTCARCRSVSKAQIAKHPYFLCLSRVLPALLCRRRLPLNGIMA